jgi:FixJ family two-component response regulator
MARAAPRREREIMALFLRGRPSKIIAADLGIGPRSVETHRTSVMRKSAGGLLSTLVRVVLAAAWAHPAALPPPPAMAARSRSCEP